jgi:thiamine biosynthesis lipoprotein
VDGLEVDSQNGTVLIKKKGLLVDLSGIAKGFMIDKAVARLKEEGIESALINAGGDIYCLGLDCGQPWEIGIKNPDTLSEILGVRFLIDEAIATSGGYEQFFTFQGRNYSHLIDPRQGYPAENDLLSVSVIAKNCTTADGLATAFSILGLEGVKKFFSQTPSTMRVFLVRSAGGEKKIDIFK